MPPSACTSDNATFFPDFGLFAGTRLATPLGWRAVERLQPGDTVLGFGGSRLTVHRIDQQTLLPEDAPWPIHIPAGALGNRETVFMPSDQMLIIGSAPHVGSPSNPRISAQMPPSAIVRAANLAGLRGIMVQRPLRAATRYLPVLSQAALVRVGFGLWCLLPDAAGLPRRPCATIPVPLLTGDAARRFVTLQMAEDLGAALAVAPPSSFGRV